MSTLRKIRILPIINCKIVRLHQCVNQVMPRSWKWCDEDIILCDFCGRPAWAQKAHVPFIWCNCFFFLFLFNGIIKQNIRARLPINNRDLTIRGRRRRRKRRWKSEFAFFQSSSRLLQVTNFVKCRWILLKLNS